MLQTNLDTVLFVVYCTYITTYYVVIYNGFLNTDPYLFRDVPIRFLPEAQIGPIWAV
jgi:hypothetical protein